MLICCLFVVFVCLFICVSKDGMMMRVCVFFGWYVHINLSKCNVRWRVNIVSLCIIFLHDCILCMWEFVLVCWGLGGPQWMLLVHCRPGVSPLCVFAFPGLWRLFDLRKSCGYVSSDVASKVFSACQFNRQTHSTHNNRHWLILTDTVLNLGLDLYQPYCLSLLHVL